MTNKDYKHPINPPPELFAEWLAEAKRLHPTESTGFIAGEVARLAYRAGADQELEACCKWLDENLPGYDACEGSLHAARRPKPPSLKEQALEALDRMDQFPTADDQHIIRRALEQLND